MKNSLDNWVFFKKRGVLSEEDAVYWRAQMSKLLKVGIELEYNLPEKNGSCHKDNYLCQCVATFKPKNKQPNTSMCFEQCANWDMSLDAAGQPKFAADGNCAIAKEHGCAGIYCSAFKSPCPTCKKYDRGCNSCAELYNPNRDPKMARSLIEKELKPTNFVGQFGHSGVYKVCTDGSLSGQGGVEIATVGRRPQFHAIYKSMKQIMDLCQKHGAYTDERCSIHMHMLMSYLTTGFNADDKGKEYIRNEITEMERPVPEIILANFHQLVRKFHCALIWLGAAGKTKNQMTRWEKFRKSVLPYSALRWGMHSVVEEVKSASKSKPKYAMMNYEPVRFDEETGDISTFHYEARYLDGMMSPSIVSAHAILMYALTLKAVDISRYGVLESGNKAYMDKQKEMYKYLCNGDGDWGNSRHSDTSHLEPYIPALQEQSMQLVRMVKNVLVDEHPADRILMDLAKKPAAMRLIEGQTWAQIEEDLCPAQEEETPLRGLIKQIIDTSSITECQSMQEWAEEASRSLAQTLPKNVNDIQKEVSDYMDENINKGTLFWSADLGSLTTKG